MTNKQVISAGHSLYDIHSYVIYIRGWATARPESESEKLCTLYGFYPDGFWTNVCNMDKAISKKTLEVVKSAYGEKGKFKNLSYSECNSTMRVSKFKIPKTGTK